MQSVIEGSGFGYLLFSSIDSSFSPKQLDVGCSVKLTAKKPFTFGLKTMNIWEAEQIQVQAIEPASKTPLGCPWRVIPVSENYWQISVTPVITGDISISVSLHSLEDDSIPSVQAAGLPVKGTVDIGPSDFLNVINPTVLATKTVRAEILSDFVIMAKYDDGTEVPIKFEPFMLTFEPPKPGNISLVVTRNNVSITGSPAKITVTSPPSVKLLPIASGARFIAGRKSMVPIELDNIDIQEVRVQMKDEAGLEVDVAVEIVDGKSYVTFVAEGAGVYTLTAGVKGNQESADLAITVLAAPVVRLDNAPSIVYAGEPHHMDFWVQNVKESDITIVAVDEKGKKVPVKTSMSSDGKLGVDLTAPSAGSLSVRVLYGNDVNSQDVRPIVFDVLEKPVCKISADTLRASKIARAQKPFNLVLETVNVNPSDLEVKIVDEKGKTIPYHLDDSVLNQTSIVFTPSAAGKLSVECLMRGTPIDGTPLPVTVLPAPTAKITKFPKEAIAGKSVYFGLDTNVTEYTNDVEGFSISVTEASGVQIPFTLKDGKVKFTPKNEGRVTFLVTVDGKPISGAPFDFNVQPAPSASLVGASDRIALPGKPFVFTIDTVNISDPKVLAISIVDAKGAVVPHSISAASTSAESEMAEAFGKRTGGSASASPAQPARPSSRPVPSRPNEGPRGLAGSGGSGGPPLRAAPRPGAINSARGLALLKSKTGASSNTYRSLSYKEMKSMNESNKETSYNVSFTPKTDGVFKVSVKLDDKSIKGCPLSVTVAGDVSAKVSGVDGAVMVNVESKCLIDIGASDPADFQICLKYADGTSQEEVLEPEADGSYACNFVPVKEGKATLEISLNGKPVKGSPIPLEVGPEPWAKLVAKSKRPFIHEQYYFHIETSFNVPATDIEIKATHANGSTLICNVIPGVKNFDNDEDTDRDLTKDSRIYWGYWVSTTEGVVTTTISLHGTELAGTPFNITVEKEAEVFVSALTYNRLGPVPIDNERGIEFVCQWQTRANTATPLSFSCATYSDLGERTETLTEGQRFSNTASIENRRLDHTDGNARALFIRPFTLPSDTMCIPIFISCLKGDFSQVRKFVICLCPTRGVLTPGYVATPPRTETAFLAGIVAKSNFGQWTFYPEGHKFAYGRFITDLIPLMNKQINMYTPHKPEKRPYLLEKARVLPVHPNIGTLEFKNSFKWKGQSHDVDVAVLPFCWGGKGGKYRFDAGASGPGVDNAVDKTLVHLEEIPEDVEAIIIVGTVRNNKSNDSIFSSLDTATMTIRGANLGAVKEERKKTKSSSGKSKKGASYYDLATYTTTHSDVGASGSIVMCKIFRRSPEASWELLPIGTGAVEVNIDELLWVKSTPVKSNQFVVHTVAQGGLGHFVQLGWRPVPKHVKVYLLEAKGLSTHPRTKSADPFATFEPVPKSNYNFEPKQSNVCPGSTSPIWNELFFFRDIGTNPKNDVSVMLTLWDYDPIGHYDYMGDCKINLKKCFIDSVKNGGRSVDVTFPLSKGGRKKAGLSAATSARSSIGGEVKLRFCSF
eukprot:TRINITY_DN5396_c0_g1_i1.p1 TRINITY_DN5396_c0_g1~~TRINITY_DN5396_c0_g1_i1.p1  ORF type:complete len:1750 (-),score=416.34 TRINITY_DN5396_c0_g1_i1:121-4707(-)